MIIRCCYQCVPPKRHTACWSTCPEYIQEKAEYEMKKEAERQRRSAGIAIYEQRERAVRKANRRHGRR